ncbi:MAG: NosD domain-containing protein [Candidatus Thorarchaeota archaeon]
MKKKFVLDMIVICMIVFSLNNKITVKSSFSVREKKNGQFVINELSISPRLIDLSLTPREPIIITHDDNFTDYGFSGSGILGDPYIIDSFSIETIETYGIYVNGTSKYFVISNCYISAFSYGIYIVDVSEGTAVLDNNICGLHYYYSIYLSNSSGSIITDNYCYSTNMKIYNSFNVTLINNIFLEYSSALYIDYISDSKIMNNTFVDIQFPIIMTYSPNNTLMDNMCIDYCKAIRVENSLNSTLIKNTCTMSGKYPDDHWLFGREGIVLENSYGSKLMNNTCSNIDYGVVLLNSSESVLKNNNFYKCGLKIDDSDAEQLSLGYIIENNYVNEKEIGYFTNLNEYTISEPIYGQLFFINCDDIIIKNQEIPNTGQATGIYFGNCKKVDLEDNTFSCLYYAIRLNSTTEATLINNYCYNNSIRIDYSHDSTIINNTLCHSGGLRIEDSSNLDIRENTFNNNSRGIYFGSSSYCLIVYNLFLENAIYAITFAAYCNYNIIHHNSFINNNLEAVSEGGSQAADYGTNNTWYDVSTNEGNYWNEWKSKKPYPIESNKEVTDPYPLNKNLKRASYGFTIFISAFVLMVILYRRYRNKKITHTRIKQ